MVFHLGAFWRLNESRYLRKLARISSVSGGSITAGVLGAAWSRLGFGKDGVAQNFGAMVVEPVLRLASTTIDVESVFAGVLLPGSVSDRIVTAYDKYLFKGATLQDLPDDTEGPRFVFNATNVQSGALWRFSKPYMRDWRVGMVRSPKTPLALAVAASSAFPPVLSPARMKVDPSLYVPGSGKDLQRAPFTTDVVLTDGGVYDNLGLETVWKEYATVLVSDAGGKMSPDETPKSDWARHSYRILDLIDNQVRSLRKRQVIDSFKAGVRRGAYWGIRTDIQDYGLNPPSPLPCPHARTLQLAEVETRLAKMERALQERLVNWGYAVCDAALRRHVDANLGQPSFPFLRTGV